MQFVASDVCAKQIEFQILRMNDIGKPIINLVVLRLESKLNIIQFV